MTLCIAEVIGSCHTGLQLCFCWNSSGKLLGQCIQPFKLLRQHLGGHLGRNLSKFLAISVALFNICSNLFGVCKPVLFAFGDFLVGIAELQCLKSLTFLLYNAQVFPLFLDFLGSRVTDRIFFVHFLKILLLPLDFQAQAIQLLLIGYTDLLIRRQTNLFSQIIYSIRFDSFFTIQAINAFHNLLQSRSQLFCFIFITFKLKTFPYYFVDSAAFASISTEFCAIIAQLFFCCVVVAEVIGVIDQITQLCPDRSSCLHIVGRQLWNIGAACKGVCIQLKQFLAEFF